jgi:hypothetical protein
MEEKNILGMERFIFYQEIKPVWRGLTDERIAFISEDLLGFTNRIIDKTYEIIVSKYPQDRNLLKEKRTFIFKNYIFYNEILVNDQEAKDICHSLGKISQVLETRYSHRDIFISQIVRIGFYEVNDEFKFDSFIYKFQGTKFYTNKEMIDVLVPNMRRI